MSDTTLTKNFLPLVFSPEDNPDADSPILQILAIERTEIILNESDGPQPRYRILVSDGEYYCQAMLAQHLYAWFEDLLLEELVVIALADFVVTEDIPGQRVLLITEITAMDRPGVLLGDPKIDIAAMKAEEAARATAKAKSRPELNPAPRLTKGFIKRAWSERGPPEGIQPVLQCISAQKFIMPGHHPAGTHTLYALDLSDGVHTCAAMLSGPMYALFECKEIGLNSILRVSRFTLRGQNSQKMMLVSAGYPIAYNGGKIGKPTGITKPIRDSAV